jgi:hypothetical protein
LETNDIYKKNYRNSHHEKTRETRFDIHHPQHFRSIGKTVVVQYKNYDIELIEEEYKKLISNGEANLSYVLLANPKSKKTYKLYVQVMFRMIRPNVKYQIRFPLRIVALASKASSHKILSIKLEYEGYVTLRQEFHINFPKCAHLFPFSKI